MRYYLKDGESILGPYSLHELTGRFDAGTLCSTTLTMLEGTHRWEPLSTLLEPPRGPAAASSPPPLPPLADRPDATGGIIPYKNPQALAAYYLGVFSLIPVLGLLLAIPALVLGILGLKQRKRRPLIGGAIHAWIGIILGAFSILGHFVIIVSMFGA